MRKSNQEGRTIPVVHLKFVGKLLSTELFQSQAAAKSAPKPELDGQPHGMATRRTQTCWGGRDRRVGGASIADVAGGTRCARRRCWQPLVGLAASWSGVGWARGMAREEKKAETSQLIGRTRLGVAGRRRTEGRSAARRAKVREKEKLRLQLCLGLLGYFLKILFYLYFSPNN